MSIRGGLDTFLGAGRRLVFARELVVFSLGMGFGCANPLPSISGTIESGSGAMTGDGTSTSAVDGSTSPPAMTDDGATAKGDTTSSTGLETMALSETTATTTGGATGMETMALSETTATTTGGATGMETTVLSETTATATGFSESTGGEACAPDMADDECFECSKVECCPQMEACQADTNCNCFIECLALNPGIAGAIACDQDCDADVFVMGSLADALGDCQLMTCPDCFS
jgi:hypothetical protein